GLSLLLWLVFETNEISVRSSTAMRPLPSHVSAPGCSSGIRPVQPERASGKVSAAMPKRKRLIIDYLLKSDVGAERVEPSTRRRLGALAGRVPGRGAANAPSSCRLGKQSARAPCFKGDERAPGVHRESRCRGTCGSGVAPWRG